MAMTAAFAAAAATVAVLPVLASAAPIEMTPLTQTEAPLPPGVVANPAALPGAITVSVALKPRDPAGVDSLIAQLSDPKSPQYRHFLTEAQYTDRFGPTKQSVSAVSSYLTGKGLHVTGVTGNRQVITATGTPAAIDDAMAITLSGYRTAAGKSFYDATSAPSLPRNLAGLVRSVSGLTNKATAKPTSRPGGPIGQGGGYTPAQFRTAYSMNGLSGSYSGSGETVGITEFDAFKQSDLNAWTQAYHQPGVTPTVVPIDGGVSSPGSNQMEVTLDVEAVAATAPAAAQVVYEAQNTDSAWVDEMAKIASDNKINVLTNSWLNGEKCESAPISASHDSYSQLVAQGVTLLSASGDWGATGCGYNGDNSTVQADYPPSDPLFTGVGGTSLHTSDSAGTYSSESCWNQGGTGNTRSGGGYSQIYSTPSYQSGVNSNQYRSVPDVAMDADYGSGALSVYMNGGWLDVGGTSLSSPLWAGYIAMVDQKAVAAGGSPLGQLNPALYQIAGSSSYSTTFHDVTSGDNGTYNAGSGYDLCTGWGSPMGDALASALVGGAKPPANDFSVSLSPTSLSVDPGKSGTVTVSTKVTAGQAQNVTLAASGLPGGVTASFNPAQVSAGQSSTLTLAASSSAAPGTTNVTITGTGSVAHNAIEALTVTGAAGDFGISDSPTSATVTAGQSASTTVSTTAAQQINRAGAGAHPGVVGGQPATVDQYPYMISLRRDGSAFPGQQSCSMTLMGPHTVLGAAHCWLEKPGDKWFIYGATNLGDTGFRANVASVWVDPDYTSYENGHDVAVFTLDRDVPVPSNIVYPTIATDTSLDRAGTMGMGIGWGETGPNNYSTVLRTVNLPVAADSACANQSTLASDWKGDGSMLCVGYSDGHAGVCVGDSGSPFLVNNQVVGIFSWMSLNCDTYGVYARVTTYADEIKAHLPGNTGGGSIQLSASGLPSGATASFSPSSVNVGGSSTLTIATSASTPAGTYQVTITGNNGTISHNATFTLTVQGSQSGVLAVNNPGSQTTAADTPANLRLTASGGSQPYIWSALGLPPGMSINTSTGQITGVDYTPGGPYQVTVTVYDSAGHCASTQFLWTVH
jgi:hypothetical protein